jgi:hypothetical protein
MPASSATELVTFLDNLPLRKQPTLSKRSLEPDSQFKPRPIVSFVRGSLQVAHVECCHTGDDASLLALPFVAFSCAHHSMIALSDQAFYLE